jgi:hypothetical protein
MTPEQERGARAAEMRQEAADGYDASMASAAATREHAQSLLDSAGAIEEQAAADRDAAIALADAWEQGS